MEKHNFGDVALVQALASLKRWQRELQISHPNSDSKRIISRQLWNGNVSAGAVVQYAAEKSMLKAERWARLRNVKERSRYISSALGHRKQPYISVSKPKLCPTGGGKIEVLNDVQAVAPRLLTPEGPIRRLILQIPPGAGKTCTYLGVMAQFIGNGHTIVVVGDDDVFAVFKEGLRQCPAKVYKRMVESDGKTKAVQETVYLRDINPNMSAFCTIKSQGTNPNLQGSPYTCDPGALTWLDTRVYFFNFVMAGNWMQAWSEERKNAKGENVTSMYHEVNPFSNKLLLVVDEAHKLGVPSMEQTTERWKAAAALFPKYIASLGSDRSTNPFILVGTATVNTTQMPTLSICLPRIIKGFTDPTLFIDNDITKPPQLNLHEFLTPSAGFVRLAEKVTLTNHPPHKRKGENVTVSVKSLKERLQKFRGFSMDDPSQTKGKKAEPPEAEDRSHPCPVSTRALREASYYIYEPIDTAKNRKVLTDIWAGVVYIVDMSQDFRYYPTTNHPYPMIRAVELPVESAGSKVTSEEYLQLLSKPKGTARWTEVSQFADQTLVMSLVQSCLDGEILNLALVESLAPKWKAVAEDLVKDERLRGRSMIYPGAYNRKGCDDNYYLLLLAFYLQAKLSPFVKKHNPGGAKQHQLVSVDSALRIDREEPRNGAPAIYIVGDSTEGKYQKAEIDTHLKTGAAAIEASQTPKASDLVFMVSTREFRERQYNRYNDEVCPGPTHVPQQAAGNTIIILGEGGHKALDLKCTSNGLILTTMPGGKFQQTQGRVKRSCAFKKLMNATQLWTVNVRTYLLWSDDCLHTGPVIDQALHSFYTAQYEIIRYLEMLEASAGVGCSNWEAYSNWKKTFESFDHSPQGGFRCVHDEDLANLNAQNRDHWNFFYCSDGKGSSAHTIERGVSGDVNPKYVERSTHNTCPVSSETLVDAMTIVEATRKAKHHLHTLGRMQHRLQSQLQRKPRRFALPEIEEFPENSLAAAKDIWEERAEDTRAKSRGRRASATESVKISPPSHTATGKRSEARDAIDVKTSTDEESKQSHVKHAHSPGVTHVHHARTIVSPTPTVKHAIPQVPVIQHNKNPVVQHSSLQTLKDRVNRDIRHSLVK